MTAWSAHPLPNFRFEEVRWEVDHPPHAELPLLGSSALDRPRRAASAPLRERVAPHHFLGLTPSLMLIIRLNPCKNAEVDNAPAPHLV
jgi:hypothetical protein